ncbi:nucleoside deaminase [Xanthovirga aplysinae]|uniref:nucleoside deaminase n=1 Tax=Xanthovirga aplysinae TaxID=2529853 RepID=UPI0012BB8749|nr:nucleoside deaminase [Xanthovirga aplysinae]MTI31139.1 nucleoside deaminase [Xanthovirga aplysinae]
MNLPDEKWMKRAIELAEDAVNRGNLPYGALLVVDGKVVLEAQNSINTDHDVTLHAELKLISIATRQLDKKTLSKAVLYTSTEPCAMCAGAIYWAGIKEVVYGCSVDWIRIEGMGLRCPNKKVYEGAVNPPIVRGNILNKEAVEQHRKFWN